ncbi:MAG: 16S rRNA (uracil(1498)-N(3))-methyltransferase [Rhizobiaceae bacterium]
MPEYDFTSHRLFVEPTLTMAAQFEPDRAQANYLLNVLRLKQGDQVLLFNGRDGEWLADVLPQGRKKTLLVVTERTRAQTRPYDFQYLFAPLKQARQDYMIQKAVEMGAGVLQPVLTEFTQMRKVNLERMETHAIEAASQCGILTLPKIQKPMALMQAIEAIDSKRQIIFCDEDAAVTSPLKVLREIKSAPMALLIGPEGGFSVEERAALRKQKNVISISLGPRILRADTAAVAAMALVQAELGDWQN